MATNPPQNLYSQLEHLQSKYVGTGHPDISRHDWCTNMARDSIATYLGHASLVDLFASVEDFLYKEPIFSFLFFSFHFFFPRSLNFK